MNNNGEGLRPLEAANEAARDRAQGVPTRGAVGATDYAKLAAREIVAHWMITNGFATGHGDTLHGLLGELEWQVNELKRQIAHSQ